jgi:hypothetical protein
MSAIAKYLAASNGRGPSPSIWGDCPLEEIAAGRRPARIVWDDFTNIPVLTTPTITAEAAWGNGYAAHSHSGGTLVSGGSKEGDIVLTESDAGQDVAIKTIALPFTIIRASHNDLWFEARVKVNTIADDAHSFFLGLGDSMTLATAVPIATTAALADENLCGFFRLAADGDKLSTTYKANGVTAVVVGDDAVTLVADTYIRLGMKYRASDYELTFWSDGVELADHYHVIAAAGTAFPNDVAMGMVLALLCGSSDDAIVTMDWWKCVQLDPE